MHEERGMRKRKRFRVLGEYRNEGGDATEARALQMRAIQVETVYLQLCVRSGKRAIIPSVTSEFCARKLLTEVLNEYRKFNQIQCARINLKKNGIMPYCVSIQTCMQRT